MKKFFENLLLKFMYDDVFVWRMFKIMVLVIVSIVIIENDLINIVIEFVKERIERF